MGLEQAVSSFVRVEVDGYSGLQQRTYYIKNDKFVILSKNLHAE